MLEIRTARLNDATAMMQVRREAVLSKALSHYQQPILDAWVAVTPDRVARFKQEIADPEFLVLVAEAGSAIIGFTKAILSGRNAGHLRQTEFNRTCWPCSAISVREARLQNCRSPRLCRCSQCGAILYGPWLYRPRPNRLCRQFWRSRSLH